MNCLHDYQENIDGKFRCKHCFEEEKAEEVKLNNGQKQLLQHMINSDVGIYNLMAYLNECMFDNRK